MHDLSMIISLSQILNISTYELLIGEEVVDKNNLKVV